jgi:hypothetical protein
MKSRDGWLMLALMPLLLCMLAGGFVTVPTAWADEGTVDVNSPEAIRHALEQQTGKRVKIKLVSGQMLTARLQKSAHKPWCSANSRVWNSSTPRSGWIRSRR